MKKQQNWRTNLSNLVLKRNQTPFKWGVNDCSMFMADAVLAMTSHDPARAFRDKYSTSQGAIRALKRYGSGDLETTLVTIFGEPIPRLLASAGDVVFFTTTQGPTAGIVYGAGIVGVGERGLITLPLSAGQIFWSIEKWQS